MEDSVSIQNTTRGKVLTLPLVKILQIKNKILGKKYTLSLAFVGTCTARKINLQTRNKTYTPNTLSFQYTKNSGEIILCPVIIKKQALQNKAKYADYLAFILIHSLLHLKGLDHGIKMELLEQKLVKEFGYKL